MLDRIIPEEFRLHRTIAFVGVLTIVAVASRGWGQQPAADFLPKFRATYQRWQTAQKRGDYLLAVAPGKECLELASQNYGPDHEHTSRVQLELGELCRLTGEFVLADEVLQSALRTRQAKLATDHPGIGECHYQLAALYEMRRDTKKAVEHLNQHKKLLLAGVGDDHTQFARALRLQAAIERLNGDYTQAEKLLKQSLKICEKHLPAGHIELADAQHDLAYQYLFMGHAQKAQANLQPALTAYASIYETDHPELIKALGTQASIYQMDMNYEQAVQLNLRVLEARRQKLGPNHLYTSFTCNNLGNDYHHMGQLNKAIEYLTEATAIKERALGPESIEVSHSMGNLANSYALLGQFEEARQRYERSLEIGKKLGLDDHDEYAGKLMNLGTLYLQQGKVQEGERYYLQALAIFERRGIEAGRSLTLRQNLVLLYRLLGQKDKAIEVAQTAVDLYTKRLGATHPNTALTNLNLAVVLRDDGRLQDAEAPLNQACAILTKCLGPAHPNTLKAQRAKAEWLHASKRTAEAIRLLDDVIHQRRAYDTSVLPGLPEATQLAFLTDRDFDLAVAVTLATESDDDLQRNADMVASWIVNWKALMGENLWNQQRLLRTDSPAAHELRRELAEVQDQLAAISMRQGTLKEFANQLAELKRLHTQREQLFQRLTRLTGEVPPAQQWVELDAVRSAIPPGAVLVEYSQYHRTTDLKTDGKSPVPHLIAAIIPRKGEGAVRLVRLGRSENVFVALARYRSAFSSSVRDLKADEVASEKLLRRELGILANVVLQPLRSEISKCERWIISADGPLWQVPWAALNFGNQEYVAEKHVLTFLATSRDLVRPRSTAAARGAVIFANPNFNLGATDESRALNSCEPLPGSAEEAKAVRELLAAAKPAVSPVLHDQDHATETAVKALQRPELLLLSTHGFFIRGAGERSPNPLLRCGLALAGVNRSEKPLGDDGILTGMEVLSLDLTGTRLVMLSACDTNVGDIRSGEGTIGLRQAFQLAGAQQVLATQWSIPDRETAELIAEFVREYTQGSDASRALQKSQIATINKRRKQGGAAHPIYWAAFSVTGADQLQLAP